MSTINYNANALKFLHDTNTTISIIKCIPQKTPLWSKKSDIHGINYKVTLSNKNHTYIFDFFDSINNKDIIEAIENIRPESFDFNLHKKYTGILKANNIFFSPFMQKDRRQQYIKRFEPKAYNILACLSTLREDTLEDFCFSFGYSEDSIEALKTFEACKEQDRNLRKLWSMEQLEALEAIN